MRVFEEQRSRSAMISLFLAVLELVKHAGGDGNADGPVRRDRAAAGTAMFDDGIRGGSAGHQRLKRNTGTRMEELELEPDAVSTGRRTATADARRSPGVETVGADGRLLPDIETRRCAGVVSKTRS